MKEYAGPCITACIGNVLISAEAAVLHTEVIDGPAATDSASGGISGGEAAAPVSGRGGQAAAWADQISRSRIRTSVSR